MIQRRIVSQSPTKTGRPCIGRKRCEVYVFRAGSLGDTLVSLPAWNSIAARYPKQQLHLITPAATFPDIPDSAAVYAMTGRLGEVIRYERSRSSFREVARRVDALGRGIVYCLMPERSPGKHVRDALFMLAYLRLWPKGIVPAVLQWLGSRMSASGYSTKPEWLRLLRCVEGNPGSAHLRFPMLRVSESATARVDALLALAPGDRPVVVCPGSKMQSKRWPVNRYGGVLRSILDKHDGLIVVLVGSAGERELCQEVARACGRRARNLAGQLSLEESAALCGRAVCYFGNDTGAMHLAAAMGVRCIAVFSARDHAGKWDPFGVGHTVLRRAPSCQHCMFEVCIERKLRCLTEISTAEALAALNNCLAAST